LKQQQILNSYYGIRGVSRSKSKSKSRARLDKDSSEALSHNFSQMKSNYTRQHGHLVSVNRFMVMPDAFGEDAVSCSSKNICISNVNDAKNFRKKVKQTKEVNRSIQTSWMKSPSKSYFGADRSELSPASHGRLAVGSPDRGGGPGGSTGKQAAPLLKQGQQAHFNTQAANSRKAPAKIFGVQSHRSQGTGTAEESRNTLQSIKADHANEAGASWQTADA